MTVPLPAGSLEPCEAFLGIDASRRRRGENVSPTSSGCSAPADPRSIRSTSFQPETPLDLLNQISVTPLKFYLFPEAFPEAPRSADESKKGLESGLFFFFLNWNLKGHLFDSPLFTDEETEAAEIQMLCPKPPAAGRWPRHQHPQAVASAPSAERVLTGPPSPSGSGAGAVRPARPSCLPQSWASLTSDFQTVLLGCADTF